MSDAYIGNAGPDSAASHFNTIEFIVQQALNGVQTATICQVTRAPYDKEGNDITPGSVVPIGYVDVQPMVNQLDGRGQAVPHGVVYRLSYLRYQSGHGAIIADPKKGDIGKMVMSSRDTSVVRKTDARANPGSRRKFDYADGTYIGQPQAAAPEQYLTFLENGLRIQDKHGNKIEMSDSGIKFTDKNGNVIDMRAGGVYINGAVVDSGGDVTTQHGTSLDHHVNTAVQAGGDNTGPPP